MTFDEADRLVDKFVEQFNIQDSNEANFDVYHINKLPCTSGKLRYAHFLLAECFIKNGKLNKQMGDLLIKSYAYIARFLDEDQSEIDNINNQNTKYLNNLKSGKFSTTQALGGVSTSILANTIEFNNFLEECQLQYAKQAV